MTSEGQKIGICNGCAKCCFNAPLVTVDDILQMAKALDSTVEEVLRKYISLRMRQRPNRSCVALDEEAKRCTIYDARPEMCQEYFCEGART